MNIYYHLLGELKDKYILHLIKHMVECNLNIHYLFDKINKTIINKDNSDCYKRLFEMDRNKYY